MILNSASLKQAALKEGFDLAGVTIATAPRHYEAYKAWIAKGMQGTMDYLQKHIAARADLSSVLPNVKSVLVVALNYNQQPPPTKPRIARYALGRDYHKVVKKKLRRVAEWAKSESPNINTRICVDSAPILERDYAEQAGIGWYGKNTCIINTKQGSWFFLGMLLLDIELEPDMPSAGGCGTCRACIDACPTGALLLTNDKPIATLDARKCISYLTIEHKGAFEPNTNLHDWLFGCDICQEVCPFNHPRENAPQRANFTSEPDFQPRTAIAQPDFQNLAAIGRDEFQSLYSGTALMRAGSARIRRNLQFLRQNQTKSPSLRNQTPAASE